MLYMLALSTPPSHARIPALRTPDSTGCVFILVDVALVERWVWILLQIGHTVGHGAIWRYHLRAHRHIDIGIDDWRGIWVDVIILRRQVLIWRIVSRHALTWLRMKVLCEMVVDDSSDTEET